MNENEDKPVRWGKIPIPFVALAWFVSVAMFVWYILIRPQMIFGVDFGKHWYASGILLAGGSPYEGEWFLSFNYPLLVGFLYIPLDWFSIETAQHIFDAFNSLYMIIAVSVIAVMIRPNPVPGRTWIRHLWIPLILIVFASSNSLQRMMSVGNIDGLNVMLLTVFLVLVVRGFDRLAGVALALVILIKIAPVLFILPIFALRKWKCLAVAGGLIVLYWVMLLITGWASTEVALYRDVLPGIPWFWRHISVSFHNFIVEVFFGWENINEHFYKMLVLGFNATMMSFIMVLVWLRWGIVKDSPARIMMLSFQWFIVFVPLLEITHLSWILPAFFIGIREWSENRISSLFIVPWVLSWILLINIDTYGSHLALLSGGNLGSNHHIITILIALSLITVTFFALSKPPEGAPAVEEDDQVAATAS